MTLTKTQKIEIAKNLIMGYKSSDKFILGDEVYSQDDMLSIAGTLAEEARDEVFEQSIAAKLNELYFAE